MRSHALRSIVERLNRGRMWAAGLLGPVDYTAGGSYRRPPELYLRVQRVGPLLTVLGLTPRYAIALEVPGRRSGVVRRTVLVRVELAGRHFLVSLGGESEWVRNVRAAGGRVVVGRRGRRRGATLVELPAADRPAVIRAYLLRAGRTGRSWGTANEARSYFGVSADPSMEDLHRVADRYPTFRIEYNGSSPTSGGDSRRL